MARIVQLCNIAIPTWMVTLAGCFIPIQGFFNAWVYFRPRFKNSPGDRSDKSKLLFMRRIIWVSLCCCFNPDRYNQLDGKDIEGIRENNNSNNTEETTEMRVNKQMDNSK